nr:Calcium/proton antiporter [Candidatus Pantoea persica]
MSIWRGVKQYLIAIFPLAILVLVFPKALPGGNFTPIQALLIAAISAAMYSVFLLIHPHAPEPVRL